YRAMILRRAGEPGAEADFAYLVNHPRIDELIAQYKSEAITIYHHRTTDLLRAQQPAKAIEVAKAGLLQADRFDRARGESHYALARAFAAAAQTDRTLVPRVLEELEWVSTLKPRLLGKSFDRDPYFADIQDELPPHLKRRR